MTTNEVGILQIVWNWGGEASVDTIAREAGISIDYVEILCKCLMKEGYIDFLHSKLCKIKGKGKVAVAGKRGQSLYPPKFSEGKLRRARKIVIPERPSKFGLGKDKRGRIILNYG